eukprot:10573578-Lingulodinium_polyedra.AAC.1
MVAVNQVAAVQRIVANTQVRIFGFKSTDGEDMRQKTVDELMNKLGMEKRDCKDIATPENKEWRSTTSILTMRNQNTAKK